MSTRPPSFKEFKKPPKMKRFVGFNKRPTIESFTPPPPVPEKFSPGDSRSDMEKNVARELGDDELAKRAVKLLEKHPYGSIPEMLAMDWLDKNLADYVYQAKVNGGFRAGGTVPDFVLRNGDEGIALLVQGEYWHNLPGKKEKDAVDKLRMVGQYTNGVQIRKVVFVWETRLMRSKADRDQVMADARSGVELGP